MYSLNIGLTAPPAVSHNCSLCNALTGQQRTNIFRADWSFEKMGALTRTRTYICTCRTSLKGSLAGPLQNQLFESSGNRLTMFASLLRGLLSFTERACLLSLSLPKDPTLQTPQNRF